MVCAVIVALVLLGGYIIHKKTRRKKSHPQAQQPDLQGQHINHLVMSSNTRGLIWPLRMIWININRVAG